MATRSKVYPMYLNGLRALDVPPPIVVMISLTEVNDVYLGTGRYYEGGQNPIKKYELLLPEIIIEDYGSEHDYQKAMKPAFDALWNTFDYAESQYFNDRGIWIGEK